MVDDAMVRTMGERALHTYVPVDSVRFSYIHTWTYLCVYVGIDRLDELSSSYVLPLRLAIRGAAS